MDFMFSDIYLQSHTQNFKVFKIANPHKACVRTLILTGNL